MSSGRYTAYHIYQDLSFTEAQKAGTRPYKLPEYQCLHSQRGYLFQFENMVERTHFDAATTTCCNEPVMNFASKPQYAEASKPMTPKDCGSEVASVGCTVLEVFVESSSAICASSEGKIRRIKIQCPSACRDLADIQGGGSLAGRYGEFRSVGMEAGEVLILDYVPYKSVADGWYDNCSGTGVLTEVFCGGYSLSYSLQAGLDRPGGCGCDCCGVNGSFPAPYMTLHVPGQVTADWTNFVYVTSSVSGDAACSNGNLTGTFHGIGGATSVPWNNSAQYHSDGFTRYVTRDPGAVGSNSNSACCGGYVSWQGTDGCGGSASAVTTVNSRITSSTISPASGTTLYEQQAYTFSGAEACAWAPDADLVVLDRYCITNGVGNLTRGAGYLSRALDSYLHFSGTHSCSGCCGNGWVSVGFDNGCGGIRYATYDVKRPLAYGAYNILVGRVFRCEQFYRPDPPTGFYYRIGRADLFCDGHSGDFSHPFADYYGNLQDCISGISGAQSMAASGAGGCANLSGGPTCCVYADNGLGGTEFRSQVASVSGICCSIDTNNGAWVFSGTDARCCPN